MPLFEYEVADRTGALGRGRAEAEDRDALMRRFHETGQLVLSVRPAGPSLLAGVSLRPITDAFQQSLRRLARGVRLATLVLFTGQLAAMLEGGIHLVRILTTLARETTNVRFKKALEDVNHGITGGSTFADALGRHPHIFNSLYVSVVRAGELSGSLPIVLNTLTIYLEKADQLRRKVRGAIAYPAVILTVSVLIVFIMIVKIVPIFESVYARANAKLPIPTLLLIKLSRLFRDYTLLTLLGLFLLGLLVFITIQTPQGRLLLDGLKLRVPLFGALIRKAIMARICRTLSVLLQAGTPLIESLDTVSRVAGNRVIEAALVITIQRVRDGGTIAETLRQTGEFPGMVTQLIGTGEESGTLPLMLGKAAVYYEQQVENTVATLSTLIEPVMIVFMGAIAGGLIFALYLPIFSLGQAMRGGFK
jgi:type IV pilus assembly protein PilC